MVKNPSPLPMQETEETQVRSLSQEEPLEKGKATHFSILAWEIPWTEELCGLYSPWGCKESDITEHTRTHMASRTQEAPLLTSSPVYYNRIYNSRTA